MCVPTEPTQSYYLKEVNFCDMEFLQNLLLQICSTSDFSESIFGNATLSKPSNNFRNNTERKFIEFCIFSKLETDNLILALLLQNEIQVNKMFKRFRFLINTL